MNNINLDARISSSDSSFDINMIIKNGFPYHQIHYSISHFEYFLEKLAYVCSKTYPEKEIYLRIEAEQGENKIFLYQKLFEGVKEETHQKEGRPEWYKEYHCEDEDRRIYLSNGVDKNLLITSGLLTKDIVNLFISLRDYVEFEVILLDDVKCLVGKDIKPISELPLKTRENLGFKFTLTWIPLPIEIKNLLNLREGDINNLYHQYKSKNKNIAYLLPDAKNLEELIRDGMIAYWEKAGEKYLYYSPEFKERFALACGLGYLDLSDIIISDRNDYFEKEYSKWLKKNNYARCFQTDIDGQNYQGIGIKEIYTFRLELKEY